MVMPVALLATSSMDSMPWSSIFWRVTTVRDWGVSRMDSGSLVEVLISPVV